MKKLLYTLLAVTIIFSACEKEEDDNSNSGNNNTSLQLGDYHQGGIIFWLNVDASSGYVCDITNLGSNSLNEWGCFEEPVTGAQNTSLGSGIQNTSAIINAECWSWNGESTAAQLCENSTAQGYSDWFLPSKEELNQMYARKDIIEAANGVTPFTVYYWSSSEVLESWSGDLAYGQYFNAWDSELNGEVSAIDKNVGADVRAIRSF